MVTGGQGRLFRLLCRTHAPWGVRVVKLTQPWLDKHPFGSSLTLLLAVVVAPADELQRKVADFFAVLGAVTRVADLPLVVRADVFARRALGRGFADVCLAARFAFPVLVRALLYALALEPSPFVVAAAGLESVARVCASRVAVFNKFEPWLALALCKPEFVARRGARGG